MRKHDFPFAAFAIFILTLVLMSGCLRFRLLSLDEPTVVFERVVFCASLDQKKGWAEPIGEKALFMKGVDSNVYSFLNLRDLHGVHSLFWKWYAPSRRLYRVTDKISVGEEGKIFERYIAWDVIYISEDKESGAWTVAVFMDDKVIAVKDFEIK
jgi:hypothetical protein